MARTAAMASPCLAGGKGAKVPRRRVDTLAIKTQGPLFSSVFVRHATGLVEFPRPWRFLRPQLEATLLSLVAAGSRAVVGSAACGDETLLAATSRPRG